LQRGKKKGENVKEKGKKRKGKEIDVKRLKQMQKRGKDEVKKGARRVNRRHRGGEKMSREGGGQYGFPDLHIGSFYSQEKMLS
jgi:hypothetical protein